MNEKKYHHGNLRQQLIESGIELLNEEGLNGFSLRKVATKCNVSHTAPYSHFKDVNELIHAMGEHVTDRFMEQLNASIQGKEDNPEAIRLLGQAYIDFFHDNPQYFPFLFHHAHITINLDMESDDDYPPFVLFRTTAFRLFRVKGMKEEAYSPTLIYLWSVVHGISSLLTNSSVHYSGNWQDIFTNFIHHKEETL